MPLSENTLSCDTGIPTSSGLRKGVFSPKEITTEPKTGRSVPAASKL